MASTPGRRDWMGEVMQSPGGGVTPAGTAPTELSRNVGPSAPVDSGGTFLEDAVANSPVGGLMQLGAGLSRNPLVAFAMRHTLGNILRPWGGSPELVQQRADEFAQKWEEKAGAPGKVLHLIGEYGPDFWLGTRAMAVTDKLVTRALAWAAPKLTAVGAGAGAATGGIDGVVKAWVGSQGERTAGKLLEGALSTPGAKPALMRGAEIAGNMGATGAYTGVRSYAEPDTTPADALRDAAYGAALAGLLEGGITLAGKAIIARAGENKFAQAAAHYTETTGLRPKVGDTEGGVAALGVGSDQLNRMGRAASRLSAAQALNRELQEQIKMFAMANGATPTGNMMVSLPKVSSGVSTMESRLATGTRVGRVTLDQLEKHLPVLAQREARVRGGIDAYTDMLFGKGSPTSVFVSGEPMPVTSGPSQWVGMLRKLSTATVSPPEDFIGRVGVVGTRLFDEQKNMWAEIAMEQSAANVQMVHWTAALKGVARDRLGVTKFDKVGAWARPFAQAYEQGGPNLVREKFGDIAGDVMADIDSTLARLHRPAVKQGAMAPMDFEKLSNMGTPGGYLPHVMIPKTDEKSIVESITKQLRRASPTMDVDAARFQAEKILKGGRRGPSKVGNLDNERFVPGTLVEKITASPGDYAEPLMGIQDYMHRVIAHNAIGSRFGYSGEVIPKYLALARAEGADTNYLKSVMDATVGRRYQDQAFMRLAHTVTSIESALKMPFAVIQNVSQPVMNTITTNLDNSAKGFWEALKVLPFREQRNALAFHAGSVDSVWQSVRRSALNESRVVNWADKANDFVLGATGFTPVEMYLNRTSGVLSARFQIMDDLARVASGDLRGKNLDVVRRRLGAVGIDMHQAAEALAKSGPDARIMDVLGSQVETASYRLMQRTQFAKDPMSIPLGWHSPLGTMASQFKMYPLGIGRMFRDAVWAEAAHGNLRPLAHFTLIAPLAGELVNGAVDFVKGNRSSHSRNAAAEYLDSMLAIGGLGLWSAAVMSAKYGRLSDLVMGPALSDINALSQATLQGRPDLAINHLARQPITQAARTLYETADTTVGNLRDWASQYGGDAAATPTGPAVSLDTLRLRPMPGEGP